MKVLAERNRNVPRADVGKLFPTSKLISQPQKPCTTALEFGGGNTLISVDYANDIFRYLLHLETQDLLCSNFLDNSETRIDGRMRQILVDWLVHVQRRFDLLSETLSLAVWILDRSLMKLKLNKSNLQLLGVSCIFVAAKYEEIMVPNIQDFVYVSADVFTKKDVLSMEQQVLKAIDFRCNITHSIQFLRQYRHNLSTSKELYSLSKFICDVGLVAYALAHHKSSVVAAVSVYLASHILEHPISPKLLRAVVGLDQDTLESVAREFVPFVLQFADPSFKLYALRDKHQKEVPIPFSDSHIKRLKSLTRC